MRSARPESCVEKIWTRQRTPPGALRGDRDGDGGAEMPTPAEAAGTGSGMVASSVGVISSLGSSAASAGVARSSNRIRTLEIPTELLSRLEPLHDASNLLQVVPMADQGHVARVHDDQVLEPHSRDQALVGVGDDVLAPL